MRSGLINAGAYRERHIGHYPRTVVFVCAGRTHVVFGSWLYQTQLPRRVLVMQRHCRESPSGAPENVGPRQVMLPLLTPSL